MGLRVSTPWRAVPSRSPGSSKFVEINASIGVESWGCAKPEVVATDKEFESVKKAGSLSTKGQLAEVSMYLGTYARYWDLYRELSCPMSPSISQGISTWRPLLGLEGPTLQSIPEAWMESICLRSVTLCLRRRDGAVSKNILDGMTAHRLHCTHTVSTVSRRGSAGQKWKVSRTGDSCRRKKIGETLLFVSDVGQNAREGFCPNTSLEHPPSRTAQDPPR